MDTIATPQMKHFFVRMSMQMPELGILATLVSKVVNEFCGS